MSSMAKNLILWILIVVVLLMIANSFRSASSAQEISYTQFINDVERERVSSVELDHQKIRGLRKDNSSFEVVALPFGDDRLLEDLLKQGVEIRGKEAEGNSILLQLFTAALPILILIGVFMLFMRQMQGMGGRGGPMVFLKSRARLLTEDQTRTTFADVAGIDEAKDDVQQLVEFLCDVQKFQRLGGRIPRGTLLVGAPGTGKTLLARAIAGEANVPFFSISGSDFVEMFVGVGASRVRDMFEQAKKAAPCIVFIDEIDAVGRHRGAGLGNGHDEREQTLNQLLVEMDGFEANDGVIVIAATNRPDVLDPALKRPGRFDRQVVVPLPDIRGREQILNVHVRRVPLADDVDPTIIARGTPGFSGADLESVVNEAALLAARAGKRLVTMNEFEMAKDKTMMGAERKSMVMSETEKRNTAYHEAGHAIVGFLVPDHDQLYKITVVPRGRAMGLTMFLPEEDRYSMSKRSIQSKICTMFGGRIAEEMINGKDGVTTGASNDIEQATLMARNMVTKWGLSDRMGPLTYDEDDGEVFLGMSAATRPKTVSTATAREIEEEVRRIIDDCYMVAKRILEENEDRLHVMAEALIEFETLMPEQVEDIMAGGRPRAPVQPEQKPRRQTKTKSKAPSETEPIGKPAEDS